MRKIFLMSFFLISFSASSQGDIKKEIQWLTINQAEKFAKKYNNDILLFFYRPGCPECHKMKTETFKDLSLVKIINENFYPVMINGRTKDTIIYNKKQYYNQQPVEHGATFRHDLYHELAKSVNGQYYYPYVLVINGKHEVIKSWPGFSPKELLYRRLKTLVK